VDIVKGINQGCVESGCSLIGGETAQMPGMYKEGEYDVAGFCVGVVERSKIIDGSRIAPGDTIIGLASNGLHSNGYSLVRKVLSVGQQKRMGLELLRPTRIYVKQVLSLLRGQFDLVGGISHITGGSFYDKIARILPQGVDARIQKHTWEVPEIFKLVQQQGHIADKEMFHTLNMGIGMVLCVKSGGAQRVISRLAEYKCKAWVIGEAVKGSKKVELV
jgi:phosphoribosylformylglycinamidine cyclo-ligase